MFNIPKEYIKNKPLAKGNFSKDLTRKDRERFDSGVKSILLEYQIEGEKIPSLINESYNIQIIMFIKVNVNNIKNAAFIAGIIQEKIKGYAVINLVDNAGNCILNFALKRLNETDKNEIIITEKVLSETYNETLSSEFKDNLQLYLPYEKILNLSDKYCFYFEMMTKCFVLSNKYLYKDYLNLLNSKIWYNQEKAVAVFDLFKQIDTTKKDLIQASDITDQLFVNSKRKKLIQELKDYE